MIQKIINSKVLLITLGLCQAGDASDMCKTNQHLLRLPQPMPVATIVPHNFFPDPISQLPQVQNNQEPFMSLLAQPEQPEQYVYLNYIYDDIKIEAPVFMQSWNDIDQFMLPLVASVVIYNYVHVFDNIDEEDLRPMPSRKKIMYKMSSKERRAHYKKHNVLLQKINRTKPNAKYRQPNVG
jgi:hypothetical protein